MFLRHLSHFIKIIVSILCAYTFISAGSAFADEPNESVLSCIQLLERAQAREIVSFYAIFYDPNSTDVEVGAENFKWQGLPGFTHSKDFFMKRRDVGIYEMAFLKPSRYSSEPVRNIFDLTLRRLEKFETLNAAQAEMLNRLRLPVRIPFEFKSFYFDEEAQKLFVTLKAKKENLIIRLQDQGGHMTAVPSISAELQVLAKSDEKESELSERTLEVDLSGIKYRPVNITIARGFSFTLKE